MAELSVLLDSCVLFPMYLRDTLLRTAKAGLYEPYWSQEILDAAIRNLVSTGKMTAELGMNLETRIKKAFPDAMVEVPVGLSEVMTNHPGDRHVLAAAVTAKAQVIVTSNLKHFKAKDLSRWDIKAKSPDRFLTDLFDDDPKLMQQVIRGQSQDLKKPPMTVVELLALLNKAVPKFASKVLVSECGWTVIQTVQKALKYGKDAPEGGQILEGARYRLRQQGKKISVIAKDGRGEILWLSDGYIEGSLSAEDVKAFQILEQDMANLGEGQPKNNDLSL